MLARNHRTRGMGLDPDEWVKVPDEGNARL
jgi:hypothetical protein